MADDHVAFYSWVPSRSRGDWHYGTDVFRPVGQDSREVRRVVHSEVLGWQDKSAITGVY